MKTKEAKKRANNYLWFIVLLAFVIVIFIIWPFGKVLATWKQPPSINYKSYDPYYLMVVEEGKDWFTLGNYKHYSIFIGREKNHTSYGHSKAYSFSQSADEVPSYLHNCTVNWTNDGVTFVEPTGHKMFFPKKSFIGGR